LEFVFPSESDHVLAAQAPVRPDRSRGRSVHQAWELPLLGFLIPRAHLRRVPLVARSDRLGGTLRFHALRPLRKVRNARSSPVPSSGFLPLSTVLATFAARANSSRSPSLPVTPRRFAALFHAARAPGVALQSFPFSRSRARSRGPSCFPAGSRSTAQRRDRIRGFRDLFPVRADPWPRLAFRLAGLQGRDEGFPRSLGTARLRVTARVCGVSPQIGRARRTRRPARPLRSFSPLESPFSHDRHPGRGTAAQSVLSWTLPL